MQPFVQPDYYGYRYRISFTGQAKHLIEVSPSEPHGSDCIAHVVCIYACLDRPFTINFISAHSNISQWWTMDSPTTSWFAPRSGQEQFFWKGRSHYLERKRRGTKIQSVPPKRYHQRGTTKEEKKDTFRRRTMLQESNNSSRLCKCDSC